MSIIDFIITGMMASVIIFLVLWLLITAIQFLVTVECPKCDGTGIIPIFHYMTTVCEHCNGKGRIWRHRD